MSDTVILLTAEGLKCHDKHEVGFGATDENIPRDEQCRRSAQQFLGTDLMNSVDLVCIPRQTDIETGCLEKGILAELAERYARYGLDVSWDESLIGWFVEKLDSRRDDRLLERLVDENIAPRILPFLENPANERKCVQVFYDNGVNVRET